VTGKQRRPPTGAVVDRTVARISVPRRGATAKGVWLDFDGTQVDSGVSGANRILGMKPLRLQSFCISSLAILPDVMPECRADTQLRGGGYKRKVTQSRREEDGKDLVLGDRLIVTVDGKAVFIAENVENPVSVEELEKLLKKA